MKRVVISGLGVVAPNGNDVETFWRNMTAGVSGAGPITLFDAGDLPVRIACEVKDFEPTDYLDRKLVRRTARVHHLTLAAAYQAVADSGLEIDAQNGDRVGVILNTGGGGITEMEGGTLTLRDKGPRSVGPFLVPLVMANAVACFVSLEFGARGPVMTSTAACASGNYAMIEAYHILQRGEADVVIAGGAESSCSPLTVAAFARMGPLSSRNDDPERACRPFDKERDGFVLGEGSAVMIMETEEHALARNAQIYAEVLGGRVTADAYHITAPEPEARGATRAMQLAIESAGLQPADVDVIYAHGTGTQLNDVAETQGIKSVLGERAYDVVVTATKSMIGHGLGAAGALSAAAAALSVHTGIVPPTINYSVPDPDCDLDYVPNEARQINARAALVNAFGFGGQNVVLVLGRYDRRDGA